MASHPRLRPTDRFLRLFTDVRPGEGATALLLAFNLFVILTAYYCIRPVRAALILGGAGAEVQSYLAAAIAVLLVGAVPLYGALANRMPRRLLINVVTTFFAACLGVFFVIGQLQVSLFIQGIVFFLWVGVFNLMVIAQLWSLVNDIYTTEEGERLFPVVALGAAFGGVAGSFISAGIIQLVGLYQPMILAAVLLMLSLLITNYVERRERRRTEADLPEALSTGALPAASQEIPLDEVRKALTGEIPVDEVRKALTGEISLPEVRKALEEEETPTDEVQTTEQKVKGARAKLEETAKQLDLAGTEGPFRMVFRCRYLLMIGLLMLFVNWVNTTGEYILGSVVTDTARQAVAMGQAGGLTEGEYIGAFYANFYLVMTVLTVLIQLFIVSRVIKHLGVQIGLIILPLISLSAYSLLAFYPILVYVRWTKTAENATDYSLQNTVRNILFLPCTREQKYKAKQVIDSFFHRSGDVLSAALVFVGTTYLAMRASHFAMFNIVLVALWLTVALWLGREYKRLVASGGPPCQ